MPYVEVWVDNNDLGPCPECEKRDSEEMADDRESEQIIRDVLEEWMIARERGDYDRFDQFITTMRPATWRKLFYGMPADRQPIGT